MAKGKGGFKNLKLGKNVYRQLKRKGAPSNRANAKSGGGRNRSR